MSLTLRRSMVPAALLLAACGSGDSASPLSETPTAEALASTGTVSTGASTAYIDATGAKRTLTPIPVSQITPTPAAPLVIPAVLPPRIDLVAAGYVTHVKNQYSRGLCQTFATVAAVESEYLRQYGETLDLSEQYVSTNRDEATAPNWAGGGPSTALSVESQYGIAPTTAWPDVPFEQYIINDVDQVFGVAPYSAAESQINSAAYMGRAGFSLLTNEVSNYNSFVRPPSQVQATAKYGPTPGGFSGVKLNGMDPSPIEALLAAGHPVATMTSLAAWNCSSTYNCTDTGAALTNDHVVLIVGYDHVAQTFKIKNSWGTVWGNAGYATFSYGLVMRAMVDPVYVTSLRSPASSFAGNAEFRGFWSGVLNGVPGVAVVHHAVTTGIPGFPYVSPEAGDFYGDDGSVTSLHWISGGYDTNSGVFTGTFQAMHVPGGIYEITLTGTADGSPWTYTATNSAGGTVETGQWCRTSPSSSSSTLSTGSYPSLRDNSYVFPNGSCVPSAKTSGGAPEQTETTVAVSPLGVASVVMVGPNHELTYSSVAPGGRWAPIQTIAPAGTAFGKASVFVRSSGEVDVAVQGANSSLVYYTNAGTPGAAWSGGSQVGVAESAFSSPSLFARSPNGYPANETNIVVQGPNGALDYYWSRDDGKSWGHAPGAAGTITGAPQIYVWDSGEADIVAEGADNSLLLFSGMPGSPLTKRVVAGPGTTFSSPSYVVRPGGREEDIVAAGRDNALMYYWSNDVFATTSWSATIAGAGVVGIPQIVVRSNGQANVVVRDLNDALIDWTALPGATFAQTQIAGAGASLTTPSVFARTANPADEVDVVTESVIGAPVYYFKHSPTAWSPASIVGF